MGTAEVQLFLFLSRYLSEVIVWLQTPAALHPEKQYLSPIYRRLGGPRGGLNILEKGRNSTSFRNRHANPRVCSPQPSKYIE